MFRGKHVVVDANAEWSRHGVAYATMMNTRQVRKSGLKYQQRQTIGQYQHLMIVSYGNDGKAMTTKKHK